MALRIPHIGDRVIDDTGNTGIIDSLPGERVQIDAHEHWTIPEKHVGLRHDNGFDWCICAIRLLTRA